MLSREAFRFFHDQAGYVVGQRALGAAALSRAEQSADARGWSFRWEDEQEPWDGDCEAPKVHACCTIVDKNDRPIGHLGSIGLNSWRDDYQRVVEAELALEALSEEADREAPAYAERATFAGVSP